MRAFRTKEYGFLLIVFKVGTNPQNRIFLLDLWKVGIRDYLENDLSFEQIKMEIGSPQIQFFPLSIPKAKQLVERGLAIANNLEIKLSIDLIDFCNHFGIEGNNSNGALYRCFNCDKNDLKTIEIEEIITTAKLELRNDIVGTSAEKQYFFVCANCKNSKI